MPYVTAMSTVTPKQISVFDVLNDLTNTTIKERHITKGSTTTRIVERISPEILERFDIFSLINKLEIFNETNERLFEVDRKSLYREFYIPKRSGGLRKIDAPNDELKDALRDFKSILEMDFGALYHTAAYAYVKNRCTIDAIKRHQANKSKWFLKTDFSNFFGSTTLEFTMRMLSMIFPFSEVVKTERGKNALERALSLGFLNGGLPQGTPLSPMLTNLISIPIDHRLAQYFSERHMVYTRYADDMLISCACNFRYNEVVDHINEIIKEFGAPWVIKPQKTRYGSIAGSNWNLGVMLNKDNQITIGHEKKKQFKAIIYNYLRDYKNGVRWDISDVQTLQGLMSYYVMVERANIVHIIININKKLNMNFGRILREDLRGRSNG